jgi:hypothetical protein
MKTAFVIAALTLLAVEFAHSQAAAGQADVVPAPSAAAPAPDTAGVAPSLPSPLAPKGTPAYTPQTTRRKFNRTIGRLVSPLWLASTGLSAGLSQWRHSPTQWGQGAEGYARRFGAIYGLAAFRQSVLFAGVALDHEDLRYPRSQRRGFFPRTGDALRLALQARRSGGSLGFAFARTVSDLSTTMLARAVYPDRKALTGRTVARLTLAYFAGREAFSVVREFTPDVLKALHLNKLAGHARP